MRISPISPLLALTVGAVFSLPHSAGAKPRTRLVARSVGAPNAGELIAGERLRSSKTLRALHRARYGHPTLVQLLHSVAGEVNRRHPHSVMRVGDLSRRGGGPLPGHHSHQTGRDVDIGFYLVDSAGKPVTPRRFYPISADGKAIGSAGLRFDEARNWALVEALLTKGQGKVATIFVSGEVRSRLLAYAARQKVSWRLRRKARRLLRHPKGDTHHRHHFHVRLHCPVRDGRKCREFPLMARKRRNSKLVRKGFAQRRRLRRRSTAKRTRPLRRRR